MTHFCMCIKIHIPAIQRNYRFFNINREHRYFDETEIKNRVTKLSSENLGPFLITLRNLSIESAGRFKAAVSVSGIALKLFQKYTPEIIDQLFELEQNNCIEILSEPWSNSLVPFIDEKLLIRQIKLHDTTVSSIFGKTPQIFIAHSPVSAQKNLITTINRSKQGIFTYLNQQGATMLKLQNSNGNNEKTIANVYLINNKISEFFQHINYNPDKNPDIFSDLLFEKIKRNIPKFNPLIVCYNPTRTPQTPKMYNPETWTLVIKKMLADPGIIFSSPHEIIRSYNHFSCEDNVSNKLCQQFKLRDFWLKNSLQTDAFEKQQKVNRLLQYSSSDNSVITEWEIIQDKEFLYYMDNLFIHKKYREVHYNPFPSPYLAYINYMNILDDISERLLQTKTSFLKIQQASIF